MRIIGGQWRRTRLDFDDRSGLRPTPDRVRETLFNWLAPHLVGARCADLFAGTGALGLEALSRGAASACFVERDTSGCEQLRDTIARLDAAASATVVCADVMGWIAGCDMTFDLVFVDPPYDTGLQAPCLARLIEHNCLHPQALVYVEAARGSGDDAARAHALTPPGFSVERFSSTREIDYALLTASG